MNYDFIIGTIIGVVGLILTWICSKEQIKSYFKPSMKDLLNQLTSTSLSPRGQKAILRKINRKLKIYGKSLSSDYIDTSLQRAIRRQLSCLTCALQIR